MMNSTDKLFVSSSGGPLAMDRRWKTNIETAPNCPRCASTNTKFCYYNNYSLSQPRYFCKGCRRYWTKGGTLRNVPFGGGCRKHRRGKSARLSSPAPSPNSDRVGSSYSSSSQPSSDGSLDDGKSGSDIDLAVVFSKFLNPESGTGSGFMAPEITHQPIAPDNISMGVEDQEYGGVFGPEFERIAEFMDTGLEMGQVQPLLISDGVSQDMLWTEEDPDLTGLCWGEEQEQVHGFDGVMDDHSMFHNSDNVNGSSSCGIWNSFDILGYGT